MQRSPAWHWPLLVLLGIPVFFCGLGSYSVVSGDEGFYHSVAAMMVETGNWFHLDFFGQHRLYDTFLNAPLQYWARAVLISVFGDNLWTMRLLSATFGMLTVLAVYRLAATLDPSPRKTTALFAALIQLTCYQFVFLHSARTGELDSIVAFLMTAIAICFLRATRENRSFLAHHLLLAVLLTIKTPVAIIPVLAELALFATTPALRSGFRRYVLSGFAIVPVGLIWHFAQAGSWWDDFVEVARRLSAEAMGARGGPENSGSPLSNPAFYAHTLLFGAFPWSIAVVPALLAAVVAAVRKPVDDQILTLRVSVLFATMVWIFFALVSKRYPWYTLPAFPFFAVCIAWWLTSFFRSFRWTEVLACAGVFSFTVWLTAPTNGLHPLATRAPRFPMETAWRTIDGIDPLMGWLVLFALIVSVLWFAQRKWPRRAGGTIGTALFGALLLLAAYRVGSPLTNLQRESELERFYGAVEADRAAGRPIQYPLSIPDAMGYLRIRHYFGRNYHVERRTGGPGGAQILITGERR